MDKPQANAKLGAAVMGGYLLGRFKKGRSALRLASYLNGGQTPPEMMIGTGRQGVQKLLANDQAKEILEQVKGPLLEAIQRAALAQVSSRVDKMSTNLQDRTEKMTQKAGAIEASATDVASQGGDKAKETGKSITDRLRRKNKGQNGSAEGSDEEPEGDEEPETTEEPEEQQSAAGDEEPEGEPEDPEEGQEEDQAQEQEPSNA